MLTLIDLYTNHYVPLRLFDASESCRTQYDRNIRRFGDWLGHTARVTDLNEDNILRHAGWLIQTGNRSAATANKVLSQLRALWEFAARRRLTDTFPAIKKLREAKRAPVAWSEDQMRLLIKAAREVPGTVGFCKASDWWVALHLVLWDSGCRIGALLDARSDQLQGNVLILPADNQKQYCDQRFKLRHETLDSLGRLPISLMLFPWPRSRSNLWDHYKRLLKRAGLPTDRRSKFQRMRRSVASHYEVAGGDATQLLGHSSRTVTKAYLDPIVMGAAQACDVLPSILPPGPPTHVPANQPASE